MEKAKLGIVFYSGTRKPHLIYVMIKNKVVAILEPEQIRKAALDIDHLEVGHEYDEEEEA
jgi:hypothetical protein